MHCIFYYSLLSNSSIYENDDICIKQSIQQLFMASRLYFRYILDFCIGCLQQWKSHSKGYGMDIYDDGEGIVYAVADGEIVSTYNGCKHVNKSNDTCNGGYGNYIK